MANRERSYHKSGVHSHPRLGPISTLLIVLIIYVKRAAQHSASLSGSSLSLRVKSLFNSLAKDFRPRPGPLAASASLLICPYRYTTKRPSSRRPALPEARLGPFFEFALGRSFWNRSPSPAAETSHGSPVASTKRMPHNTPRFGMRGHPPRGLSGAGGGEGSITARS